MVPLSWTGHFVLCVLLEPRCFPLCSPPVELTALCSVMKK